MLLEASIRVQEQVKARRIECNSTMFFKMRKITIIHQHDSMQCRCLCNCHKILIVIHWIFRKLSNLCPRIKAFFAYCKIQKRAEVRSFPYCYLYNIGKLPTSCFSIKVQFRASYPSLTISSIRILIIFSFYALLANGAAWV